MTATIERQALADWVREDGHDGCAILIEEAPAFLLPSVLTWTARHLRQHVIFVDDDALDLPVVLLAEAENRRTAGPGTSGAVVPVIVITACLLLAAFAEHRFAG